MENTNDIFEQVQAALPEDERSDFREKTRGKSRYVRRAITYIFNLSPAEFAAFVPRNGYDEAAIALRKRCADTKFGNAALTLLRDSLGESPAKNNMDKPSPQGPGMELIDDMPRRKVTFNA
jgi:hypothetical protein